MLQDWNRAWARASIHVLSAVGLCLFMLAGMATSSRAGTVTVHTSPFLFAPTNRNGFESMVGGTEHSEDGISVSYVGRASFIWTTSQAIEGEQSWYPNGGGFGFTRIQLAQTVSAFQFAAGSGWRLGEPGLQYRLLSSGILVAEGVIEGLPRFSGFNIYGFSGLDFDELQLQALADASAFNAGGLDALTLDDLAFGGTITPPESAVPEPRAWAMMLIGFGLLGARLRRQAPAAATAAA